MGTALGRSISPCARRRLFAALALALLIPAPGAGRAEMVQEAVESALATNPEARAAEANRRAAGQGLNQARGGYFPTFDVQGEAGREHTKSPILQSNDLNRRDGSLTLRQYLFDGFQVTYEVERQTSLVSSATWRVEETRLSLAQRVVNAYLDILRNQELVRLASETVKAHEAHVEKTRLRLKQGVGPRADVQQAEGRLALAISTLVSQEGTLREAGTTYFRLVGRMPVEPVKPPSPSGFLPQDVKQALEKASAGHPTVKAAQADMEAAESAASGSKSTLVPRLDLELSANSNVDTSGIVGTRNEAAAMVIMRYNLFRGGSDLARTKQLAELQRSSEETLNNARLVVEEEVGRAWIALHTSREALAHLVQRVQSSEQVLEAYRLQFELGRRTLIDLLNAENELFQAKSGLSNGQYAVLQNEYRVVASMGGLVSVLGIAASAP